MIKRKSFKIIFEIIFSEGVYLTDYPWHSLLKRLRLGWGAWLSLSESI